MSFFDQRFSGDIVSREQNNEEIAAILFQRIVPSIMDLVLVCCLMFLMFLLDPRMAGVVLAAGVMQLLCILALTENYGNLSRGLGRDGGKLSGIKLSGISMIETVKASGAERGIVEKILGYQAKYDNAALKMASSRIYLETAGTSGGNLQWSDPDLGHTGCISGETDHRYSCGISGISAALFCSHGVSGRMYSGIAGDEGKY